jgi:hypothetical protein
MDDDSTRQSVLFSDLSGKPIVAKFDQEHASRARSGTRSEIWCAGGCMPLRAVIRMAMIARRLGADPIQKLLCGRDPIKGFAADTLALRERV